MSDTQSSEYIDLGWIGTPSAMAAALTALGWAPDGSEPTQPRHAAIPPGCGFVVRATTDVSGSPVWAALIRATEVIPTPSGIQTAPQWVMDALVGRIAEIVAPQPITRRQLLIGMAMEGLITMSEAVEASKTGAVPQAVEMVFSTLQEPAQSIARITWASMSQAERSNELVGMMASAKGINSEALDALWWGWSRL